MLERRLKEIEMNRRHLRTEYRVLMTHFLCEFGLRYVTEFSADGLVLVSAALVHDGYQRTQTNSRRAEVIYLVYFKAGVEVSPDLQKFPHKDIGFKRGFKFSPGFLTSTLPKA